jgi:hypothetical protein
MCNLTFKGCEVHKCVLIETVRCIKYVQTLVFHHWALIIFLVLLLSSAVVGGCK